VSGGQLHTVRPIGVFHNWNDVRLPWRFEAGAGANRSRVFPPLFNRYQGGQSFGTQVDNAIRQVTGTGHRIRTDFVGDALPFAAG
jgi:hypothetical protein